MNKKKGIIIVVGIIGALGYLMSGGSKPIMKSINSSTDNVPSYSEVVFPKSFDQARVAGEGVGVSITAGGDIVYLHRSNGGFDNNAFINEDLVIIFERDTFEIKDSWGKGLFIAPHGLHVDQNDNVWIVDTELNQVMKFDMKGNLIQKYGNARSSIRNLLLKVRNVLPNLPVPMSKYTFAKPTDVTVLKNGNFCVSDGYRNSRIVMFDKAGKFLWERKGLGSNAGEFNIPHGISSDHDGNIYVADRSNGRIQIFDVNGMYRETWNDSELCKPFGIDVKGDYVFVADGGEYLYGSNNPTSQIIVYDLSGNIIDRFSQWGEGVGELMIPHDIAVDRDGSVFVAELNNRRIQMMKWNTVK